MNKRIKWNEGKPPETQRGKRLLLIARPDSGPYDAAADNRPDIYIGHYGYGEDGYVPARIWGMSANEPRPKLDVKFWAEIELPDGIEVRNLTVSDYRG
ncbi:MAG: hypothetical protein ACLPTZ_13710 [Beijerinckiaceae bacterium]